MNKNLKLLYACLLLVVAGMVSCSKSFVEKRPINAPTDANFWNNEADATGALAGAYSLLRASLNEMGMAYYYYGDMNTDEFVARPNGEDYPALTGIAFNAFVAPSQNFRGLIKMRRWDNFYRAIDEENRCIKYIQNIGLDKFTSTDKQGTKNSLIGEAYFLRAFTYFYISRVWGDVPLVTETAQDAATVAPAIRAPQATVLDQCIKDIQEANKLLNYAPNFAANRPIKANKGTCFALLAHIYAWRGDYDKVNSACDSVINNGGYTYVAKSSKAAYIAMYKGNSTESIFEISQNTTSEGQYITAGYGDIINCIAARTLKVPYIPLTSTGTSLFGLDLVTVANLYPNGPDSVDYRRKNVFDFWGTTDPICIKYSNIVYTGANNTLPMSVNNIVIFRLADIKLLKAEALAATGKPGDARTIVNEIRTVAGIGPTSVADGDMFAGVIDERARELFMEGHRYYDLIRLAKKTGTLKFNGSGTVNRMDGAGFAAGKYYWPVEPTLISLNPLLAQTPYWADKM